MPVARGRVSTKKLNSTFYVATPHCQIRRECSKGHSRLLSALRQQPQLTNNQRLTHITDIFLPATHCASHACSDHPAPSGLYQPPSATGAMAPRAKVASLTSMVAAVKDQKKSSATGLQASIGQAKKDYAAQARADSSSSDSASDSDDSGSDSDAELDLDAERKKLNAKSVSTTKPVAAVNGSKAAPPATSKPAPTKAAKPESDSDSDSEEESEDSDESESETKAPAKPAAAPAIKATATKEADSSSSEEESGSEEESESESEEEAVVVKAPAGAKIPTKPVAAVVAKPTAPPQESSDEESGSDSDSESEEEDDAANGTAVTQSNGVSGTAV